MATAIVCTALFKAMMTSGRYSQDEAIETISDMRAMVGEGADPEELLQDEGFEPDYIFDILP